MKTVKKVMAVLLSAMFVALCFAGCSSSGIAEEITAETMLIAYKGENKPFIYTDDKGQLTGFDVEIFESIFDGIKNDYKNYKFVEVDEDYRIGEDVYCTDADGKDCIAYILVGGVQKDVGAINNECTFTEDVINNRIITVVSGALSSNRTYADLKGATVGVVGDVAQTALDKHTAIKSGLNKIIAYDNAEKALADLEELKINAVVIDEFSYNVAANKDVAVAIDGELDNISYTYAFKKWDWFNDAVNEAIYELKSPDYGDADTFTPIVEKYFGYNASSFSYNPV